MLVVNRTSVFTCLSFQTTEEFKYEYEKRLGNNIFEPAAPLTYDAVWALAKALNK